MIEDNPTIRAVNNVIGQYKAGQLDIAGLQKSLASPMTVLEGDVPRDIRDVISRGENEIEFIRFMNSSEQRSAVEKVLTEIENTVSKYV